MKLHLESNVAEGTPEELVKYQELLKEKEKEEELLKSGHMHVGYREEEALNNFKGLLGSLKVSDSYTESTESSTDEADLGEFYIVNVDNSALSKGTILKKVDKHTLKDSLGDEYLHVDANAVEHIDKQLYNLEDRFSFATQVGVRLSDNTDLAQATEGDYFKVTDSYVYLNEGGIVTIAEDDRDNQPQCKDEYGNSCYVFLGHLELIQDSTESSTEEAETSSTELQVGDRVKVLDSACGAVGEATVTAIHENGEVEIAGTSREGIYLSNWSSHVTLLEKIEEEPPTELQVGDRVKVLESAHGAVGEATVTAVHENGEVEIAGTSRRGTYANNWSSHTSFLEKIEEEEDVEVDPEEAEGLLGYTFWYLDTANFNTFVVLKASLEGYFEDSTGKRYTYQAVSGYAKPVTTESVREVFEEAEREGSLLKYFPTIDMFDKVY